MANNVPIIPENVDFNELVINQRCYYDKEGRYEAYRISEIGDGYFILTNINKDNHSTKFIIKGLEEDLKLDDESLTFAFKDGKPILDEYGSTSEKLSNRLVLDQGCYRFVNGNTFGKINVITDKCILIKWKDFEGLETVTMEEIDNNDTDIEFMFSNKKPVKVKIDDNPARKMIIITTIIFVIEMLFLIIFVLSKVAR